jgi:hypothetical protein
MAPPPRVPPLDDRRATRFEVDGEVRLKVFFTRTDDVREISARLKNVSPGGIFVETTEEIPPGVLADLDLRLEGAPLANTLGLVRWWKPGEGVGIEFFYATEEERDALDALLADWVRRRRARS